MEKNRLWIAIGVLAALVIAVYFAWKKPSDEGEATPKDPWHAIERAQITKIVIRRPGNDPAIELEKRDNKWVMNQPGQGPADETAVNDALEALSEMHVASVAAREASSHEEMEVDAAHAIHVTLFRGAAQALDLLVGKNLDGGTAVLVPGHPEVLRVDRSVRYSLAKEPREWRDRNVTHLERDHVRSVEWHKNGATYHFDRSGETWTAAAGNPAIERLDTAKVNQVVSNLLALRATDFAAANANTGLSPASPSVTINLDNGPAVTLRVGGPAGDGEVYVQREGSDVVYVVGHSHQGEIDLDVSLLQAPVPTAGDAGATDASAPSPAAMPGDASIPPEVMEQIRRQLQQRGVQMPH